MQIYVLVIIKKKDKQKFVYPFLYLNQIFHDYSVASEFSVVSAAGASAFLALPLRVDFLASFFATL